MGQSPSKKHKKKRKYNLKEAIDEDIECPFCSMIINSNFNYVQLNNHLQECGNKYYDYVSYEKCEIYSPNEDKYLNELILKEINLYRNNIRINEKEDVDFNTKIEELHQEINKYKIN